MTKLKIGKLPVYKGVYQDNVNYSRLNLVSYLGTTFQSLTDDNIGHPPAELSKDDGEITFINTDYWNIIAKGSEYNDNRIATDSNKGYKILKKNKSFAEQVTKENTIYEIRYDFNLNGLIINMPYGAILYFQGGKIQDGIILNVGKIINNIDAIIFKDVDFENPQEQLVKLKWWSCDSVSKDAAIAAKFKHVDGSGTWDIDNSIIINNDIEWKYGHFNCKTGYEFHNFDVVSKDFQEISYTETIAKGAKEINCNISKFYKYAHILSLDPYAFINIGDPVRRSLRGEIMEVASIDNGVVKFNTKYGTICEYSTSIVITFFNPIIVNISNITCIGPIDFSTDKAGCILEILRAEAVVSNSYFKGSSVGVSFKDCINSTITTCIFEEIYPWATCFTGGTCYSTVRDCKFNHNRHAWTTLGESSIAKYNLLTGNICKLSLFALCSHTSAYGTSIIGNTVEDSFGGVGSYAPNCIIKGNVIKDFLGDGLTLNIAILLTEAGAIDCSIEDNFIENKLNYGDGIRIDPLNILNVYYITPSYCSIRNNTLRGMLDSNAINIDFGDTPHTIKTIIENNLITNFGYTGIRVKNATYCDVKNNTLNLSTRGYQGINIIGSLNNSVRNYKISNIICNTCIWCGEHPDAENHHITVSNMSIVNAYNNTSYNNNLTIGYTNCSLINNTMPLATREKDGLMPKSQVIDYILGVNVNAYYKLGTFKNRYNTASIILSINNTGGRAGSMHMLNISGVDNGAPSVKFTTILSYEFILSFIYVSLSEQAVYLLLNNNDAHIMWLHGNIDFGIRNKDIQTPILQEALPEDILLILKHFLTGNLLGGEADIPEVLVSGQRFFRIDIGIDTIYYSNLWVDSYGRTIGKHFGSTENRPSLLQSHDAGYDYFDTVLNKPIYWSGSGWVDSSGTPV